MASESELRARLAQVSIDDLSAVHDLYGEVRHVYKTDGTKRSDMEFSEVARRIERAMAQAVRAAQARGEVASKGQSKPKNGRLLPSKMFESRTVVQELYCLADDISDEMFEAALHRGREEGSLGRLHLTKILDRMRGLPPPPPPEEKPVKPTARGRKTVEHLAIQMNAIALGVEDLDPREVPPGMETVVHQAFEDIGTIRSFLRKVNKNASQ